MDEDGNHDWKIGRRLAVDETKIGDDGLAAQGYPTFLLMQKAPDRRRSALGLIGQSQDRLTITAGNGLVFREIIEQCTEPPG